MHHTTHTGTPSSSPIKHIILLMFENRSYDNVLGHLYHPSNSPPYDHAPPGQRNLHHLTGKESNPDLNGNEVKMSRATATNVPTYDPGESFGEMAQQAFGLATKASESVWGQLQANDNIPMNGFVKSYACLKPEVPADHLNEVMTYFTPDQVPVSSFLAHNYGVCDEWFASVPCQTLTNRRFPLHASPAVVHSPLGHHSIINDFQYGDCNPVLGGIENDPSIFSLLDNAFPNEVNWKVYFHDFALAMLVSPYAYKAGLSHTNKNVATYDYSDYPKDVTPEFFGLFKLGARPSTFLEDLEAGTLPKFSLIEPRYTNNVAHTKGLYPNSNHPGEAYVHIVPPPKEAPASIDVYDGELFLAELYNKLQASPLWESTLLIITYDEHGGMFDHIPIPKAVPPGDHIPPAYDVLDTAMNGFNYNYLGFRLPAIIVSPLIPSGSTIRASVPFDHTSVIQTVRECFTPSSPPINQRDAAAPSLLPFIDPKNYNNAGPAPAPVPPPGYTPPVVLVHQQVSKEDGWAQFKAKVEKSFRWFSHPAPAATPVDGTDASQSS